MAQRERNHRLLNLCPTAEAVGGVARIAVYTGAHLGEHGWDVRTVFPAGSDQEILDRWSGEYGVALDVDAAFFAESGRYSISDLRRLHRFVRESRATVAIVHLGTQSIPPRLFAVLRSAGVRQCVAYCHAAYSWDNWGDRRGRSMRKTRLGAALCRSVIACSQPVADLLMETGIPVEKITVINTGVRLETNYSDRASAREVLGLPSDAFVVGTVIRFAPEKAPDVLVNAVAELDGEPLLVMQGAGELKPEIERLAHERLDGRVKFFDKSSDVSALYAACDVFALTSLNEGFPLVLQEAAAHGRPAVATDVGGVSQLVIDGVTGRVVPPGDAAVVAEAIAGLMADPHTRAEMGQAALARARSTFSEQITVDRVNDLLRSAVDDVP